MEELPLVSIIMPCYNMESFIGEAIDSVRQQTYPHWEMLIVDDASSDRTKEIVQRYCVQDSRVQFTAKDRHSGIADSRNQAIQMSKGRFLAFLDADDLWHPEKLQIQLEFMLDHQVGFTYSTYDWIDEQGHTLNKSIHTIGNLDYKDYLRNTVIGCSTVMLDRDIVGVVFVPHFRTSEDTATWLGILKKGHLAYAIDQALVSYRIRRKSASSNKLKASIDLWKVYRRQEKLPFFQAVYFFSSYAFHAIKKHLF